MAGRMARFNGAKPGLAVWLSGVVMVRVVAAAAAIAGAQYDVFAQLNLPRPPDEGQVTTVGLITIGAAILVALIGRFWAGWPGCGSTATSTKPDSSPSTSNRQPRNLTAINDRRPVW